MTDRSRSGRAKVPWYITVYMWVVGLLIVVGVPVASIVGVVRELTS